MIQDSDIHAGPTSKFLWSPGDIEIEHAPGPDPEDGDANKRIDDWFVKAGAWSEDDHPRAPDGKFGAGGGSGGGGDKSPASAHSDDTSQALKMSQWRREGARFAIANGIHDADGATSISPRAAHQMRDLYNSIGTDYGMTQRLVDGEHSKNVFTHSNDEMGNSAAQIETERHGGSGALHLSDRTARWAKVHAGLDKGDLVDVGKRAEGGDDHAFMTMVSHTVLQHEALHTFGPQIEDGPTSVALEEVVTEMSARRLSADLHGLPSTSKRMKEISGYEDLINPIVDHIAKATGEETDTVYKALEASSMTFKRDKDVITNDEATKRIADGVAKHLKVPREKYAAIHAALHKGAEDFSREFYGPDSGH